MHNCSVGERNLRDISPAGTLPILFNCGWHSKGHKPGWNDLIDISFMGSILRGVSLAGTIPMICYNPLISWGPGIT